MHADRPIFLVGCPRSGTTLLSVMLHAHPRIAMPPETRFLLPAYRARADFGDLTDPANRRRLGWTITGRGSYFSDLGLNRRAVVRAVAAAPPTFGSATATVWREFARSRGKARWGEKRPAYWMNMDVIMRLYPDAQVIHLVRDGRACVASLKQVDWWHQGALGAMTEWTLADRELRAAARRLPADSYFRLRYEDLLADPRGQLTALCTYLGEDFAPEMLAFTGAAADIVPQRKSWHIRTRGELDHGRIEAWRSSLTPAELGLFEAVAQRTFRRNGYQLSGEGSAPAAHEVFAYYQLYARRRAGLVHRRALDAVQRRRDGVPLADVGEDS